MKTYSFAPAPAADPGPRGHHFRLAVAILVDLVVGAAHALAEGRELPPRDLRRAADAALLTALVYGRGTRPDPARWAALSDADADIFSREAARALVFSEAHILDDGGR